MPKRPFFMNVPGYNNNAILHVILANGVVFVGLGMSWVIMNMMHFSDIEFYQKVIANVSIVPLSQFHWKVWTVLTYNWAHYQGFWNIISDMIWLYLFGNIVQGLIGYRQIIPLYIYSGVVGGVFYLASQMIPGGGFMGSTYMMGSNVSTVAFAIAAVTISPTYRVYFTPTFSLPITVISGVFSLLMLFYVGFHPASVCLLLGGGLTGFGYVKILKNGFRPGAWMYATWAWMESLVTPNEDVIRRRNSKKRNEVLNTVYQKQNTTQKRIDDILDKINQKGYNSLSAEEKDILQKAGKDER